MTDSGGKKGRFDEEILEILEMLEIDRFGWRIKVGLMRRFWRCWRFDRLGWRIKVGLMRRFWRFWRFDRFGW